MKRVYLGPSTSAVVEDLFTSMELIDGGPYPPLPPVTQTTGSSPVAGATMTNTLSHLGGFADTTNTGAPATRAGTEASLPRVPADVTAGTGWEWDPRGWIQVGGNNAILDGLYCTANINVQAEGVQIRNCVVEFGGDGYGISLRTARGVIIHNNTIRGLEQLGPGRMDNGIRDMFAGSLNSTPMDIQGNNIYWCSSGMNNITAGGLIQGNYIHDMGFNLVTGLDHTNGIQCEASTTYLDGYVLMIRGNTVFVDRSQTDCITVSNNPDTDRFIEHNLLGGGGYSIYARSGASETARRIVIRDNHFSRIYYPDAGYFGYLAFWEFHPSNRFEDNVWDDTGLPVELG
jgi:hypothetical protein